MMMTPVAEPPEFKRLNMRERAAALMLALGQEHGGPIWEQLSIDEVKELSQSMSQLGRIRRTWSNISRTSSRSRCRR